MSARLGLSRALALLCMLAMLLAGCAPQVSPEHPGRRAVTVADAAAALTTAHTLLTDVNTALSAIHEAKAERARAAAQDDAAKHRAIDEVDATMRPLWDAYEVAWTIYLASAAVVRSAEFAEAAGREPDAGRVLAAVISLESAVDALSLAVQTFDRKAGGT